MTSKLIAAFYDSIKSWCAKLVWPTLCNSNPCNILGLGDFLNICCRAIYVHFKSKEPNEYVITYFILLINFSFTEPSDVPMLIKFRYDKGEKTGLKCSSTVRFTF